MPYPSINFSSTVATPTQSAPKWRNSIGIIAEFSKGPTEPIVVDPVAYPYLYGNDSSVGNAVVQQAYAVGATNLTIARATPENSPATTSIYFASANTNTVEPRIGYELNSPTSYNTLIDDVNYTIGVSLEFRYLGSPIVEKTIYDKVSTKVANTNHPSFAQQNTEVNFRFVVDSFVAGGTTIEQADKAKVITVEAVAGATGTKQVITFSTTAGAGHDITDVLPDIRKGYGLSVATAGVSPLPDTIGTRQFIILSDPFLINATTYGLLVEAASSVTAGAVEGLCVTDPEVDQYILGYNIQTAVGDNFTPLVPGTNQLFSVPGAAYKDGNTNFVVDSYVRVPASSGGVYIPFKYQAIPKSTPLTSPYTVLQEALDTDAAQGIQFVFGTLGTTSLIRLIKGGVFNIPVASAYIVAGSSDSTSTLAYSVGTSAAQIVTDLYNAAAASPTYTDLLQDFSPEVAIFPYGFTLTTSLTGADADRLSYLFTRHTAGTGSLAADIYTSLNGGTFTITPPTTFSNFTNGIGGPTYGTVDLYDIDGVPNTRIVALSPGAINLTVSVAPLSSLVLGTAQFNVQVTYTDPNGVVTFESLSLSTGDLSPTVTGLYIGSITSNYVRAYFLPYLENTANVVNPSLLAKGPLRLTPGFSLYSSNYASDNDASSFGAAYLTGIPLTGGLNYVLGLTSFTATQLRQRAFLAAINRMANVNVAFLAVAGISYGDPNFSNVFEAIISQVKSRTAEVGITQLLLEGPVNALPRRLANLSNTIDNEYISIVNGHITQQLPSGINIKNVGTLGYYAGLAATRPPQISPHAPYSTTSLVQIVSSDTQSNPAYKLAISQAKVDTLYFDNGLNIWKFLDGLTTSSVRTKAYFSVNRIRAQVVSDLYNYLQWVRSLTNTTALQNKVSAQITAYMNTQYQEGWFLALGNVICNSSNNSSADQYAGKLNIQLSYVPVIPADYIYVNLIEDYSLIENLTLTTVGGGS